MTDDTIYEERVSSDWTEALFLGLTILFFLLYRWLLSTGGPLFLRAAFLVLSLFFLFHSLNYRTLVIRLTPESLKLKFGIFTWRIPLDNIGECQLDELPKLMWYGGAGIHFMLIRKRYRASFNFLEHSRVLIAFKRKVGIVQDISFSTRRPDDVIQLLQDVISAQNTA